MSPAPNIVNGTDRAVDENTIPNGIDGDSSTRKKSIRENIMNEGNKDEESKNFTITVCKKYKIRICKALIPLKIALFIWYGAAAAFGTFLSVFVKQRGITLTELSTLHALTPVVQFFGPAVSGIIADKIGRSKPVLVMNILFLILATVGMLVAPSMREVNCEAQTANIRCHHQELDRTMSNESCDVSSDVIHLESCKLSCKNNITRDCNKENLVCNLLDADFRNFSLSVNIAWTYKLGNKCYFNFSSVSHENSTFSGCNVPSDADCNISCFVNPVEDCFADNSGRTGIVILNIVLLVLFTAVYSNTYRFMDVTTMTLVKEHNSDFGRERSFAIVGVLVVSPIFGYFVDATTTKGANQNYDTAFYFFIGLLIVLLAIIYKLDVQIQPPGKHMWKKSVFLLKNPDVISFIFVLTILGASWGFTKNFMFWYLEGMKPPSILLGLVNSFGALYGLPFLFTSNWWLKKIGATQIFLLAILGYAISGLGYSLLYNPWFALLIEATCILTYHLNWVAVIRYSHSLAPEGLTATVVAGAGAVHYSLGKGCGGFVGGLIMNAYGGRAAYRVTAIFCTVSAILYAVYLYIRKTCYKNAGKADISNGIENFSAETAN